MSENGGKCRGVADGSELWSHYVIRKLTIVANNCQPFASALRFRLEHRNCRWDITFPHVQQLGALFCFVLVAIFEKISKEIMSFGNAKVTKTEPLVCPSSFYPRYQYPKNRGLTPLFRPLQRPNGLDSLSMRFSFHFPKFPCSYSRDTTSYKHIHKRMGRRSEHRRKDCQPPSPLTKHEKDLTRHTSSHTLPCVF